MKRHEPRIAAHEKDNQRPNPGKNQLQGVGQCCHGAFILRRFKATSAEAPRHFCNLQTSATYSTVASLSGACEPQASAENSRGRADSLLTAIPARRLTNRRSIFWRARP